ncbi:MAG: phage holin family protein [Chloroflexi bacterium]|nr:phage holin family protein [Chloroflexota bacterium]
MRNIVLRWLINAVALFVAAQIVPSVRFADGFRVISLVPNGITFAGDWLTIVIVAALFGLVNALIRPLVMFATCLVNVLTLGLFTLVVNAGMLLLTSWLSGQLKLGFHVAGFSAALLGAIVIGVVSYALTRVLE